MTTMSDALNRFWYVPTSNTNLCVMGILVLLNFFEGGSTFGFGPFTNQRVTNKIVKKGQKLYYF